MRSIVWCLFLLFQIPLWAQKNKGSVVIFSGNKEKFHVFLNGEKQNPVPQNKVSIKSLEKNAYRLRILFQKRAWPEIERTLYIKGGHRISYRIIQNWENKPEIKPVRDVPLKSPPTEESTKYGKKRKGSSKTAQEEKEGATPDQRENAQKAPEENGNKKGEDGDDTGMEFQPINPDTSRGNINRMKTENIRIAFPENRMKQGTLSDTSTPAYQKREERPPNRRTSPLPDYKGAIGCKDPMDTTLFRRIHRIIKNEAFPDKRMKRSKELIKGNCFLTDQIVRLVTSFAFEDDRLEIAKFAYSHVYDVENYYEGLKGAFDFRSSQKTLKISLKNRGKDP